MKRPRYVAIVALIWLIAGPAAGQESAAARLNAIFSDYWEWYSAQIPELATFRGDNRFNDRLTDASAEAVASRKAYRAELAARLKSIDRTQLGGQDRISYDVFARELGSAARMNRPGVASGNWRWRATAEQVASGMLSWLAEMTEVYDRSAEPRQSATR